MSNKELIYHIPAMLGESIKALKIRESGTYIDATFGGGGHSHGILENLGKNGKLYGFDQDADAEINIPDDPRFVFVRSNFRYISNFMRYYKVKKVDGILADLGVSSHHFDDERRGFSFRFNSRLDMRMNNRSGLTAADVLNTYTEERLADIFYLYGELSASRKIAATVISRRETKKIETVNDLLEILKPFCGREKETKYLACAFQALRIEVNQEMQALGDMLEQSLQLLKSGGRIAVITYHSLEDRLVKNFMKTGNTGGRIVQDLYGNKPSPMRVEGKATVPSAEDTAINPRVRSARLRVAEKL